MLDVGFSELLVFGIIALLVLGPEKLPEAARFAARCYSKFKTLISNVQNDIDRELRLSELREQMNTEMNRIQALEQKMQAQMQELQQQTIQAAEQQQQYAATDNKNSSFIYTYISVTQPMVFIEISKTERSRIGSSRTESAELKQLDADGSLLTQPTQVLLNPISSSTVTPSTEELPLNNNSACLDPQHADQKVTTYKVAI